MQQSFGEFDATLHSAREGFYPFLGAIGQTYSREHLRDTRIQTGSAEAVKVSLVPQILVCRELRVNALGLEDHPDLPPQPGSVFGSIAAHDYRPACRGKH